MTLLLRGRSWMAEPRWRHLMEVVPRLLLAVEDDLWPCPTQRLHVLAANLWDLIQVDIFVHYAVNHRIKYNS